MKMLLPIFILAVVSVVHGGSLGQHNHNSDYMFWPGDDGRPRLAILRSGIKYQPKAIDPSEVNFLLYSRINPDVGVEMFVGNLNDAPFDPVKETKFIAHGFTSSAYTEWIVQMKDTYLSAGDYNIILINWERPAQGPLYDNAKQRTQPVGEYAGQFMEYLQSEGADPLTFHCSGHSLGAHLCGHAGVRIQLGGLTLGRITGMDPALPLYNYGDFADCLDPSDAMFVDVIHACGGSLAFWLPNGHIDFYPNNGEPSQPGCGIDLTGSCSHSRSHEFFHESILSTDFRSVLCEDYQSFRAGLCDNNEAHPMGEHAPSSATSGSYYLATNAVPPFAMG